MAVWTLRRIVEWSLALAMIAVVEGAQRIPRAGDLAHILAGWLEPISCRMLARHRSVVQVDVEGLTGSALVNTRWSTLAVARQYSRKLT